jgi:hypothetical protein
VPRVGSTWICAPGRGGFEPVAQWENPMSIQAATSQLKPYFTFPFLDNQARGRFAIGTALLLGGFVVPILPGLLVYGYALQVLRSTADGKPPAMPPWDDWSSLLSLGLRGGVVGLVFTLPALVVFLVGLAVYFGMILLVPVLADAGASGGDPAFLAVLLAMATMFLSMALGSILMLLGTIPLPAAVTHFVVQDQFGAAFRVREWWPTLLSNRLGYFISFVLVAGILGIAYWAFFAVYSTVVLVCLAFFLMLPISLYTMLLGASLFGDAYREGVAMAPKPDLPAPKG